MKVVSVILISVLLCAQQAISKVLGQVEDVDSSPYVVNGVRSPHLPYFAHITFTNDVGTGFFGGGALITPIHVITAATNIVGFNSWTVMLGSSNRTAMRSITTNNFMVHPLYVARTRTDDIGILIFGEAVVLSSEINVIALPVLTTPALPIFHPMEFEQGFFAGMGFSTGQSNGPSQFLYRGFQRVTSAARCNQFFNLSQKSGFCAEDTVERGNICHGDIGGPFILSYRRQDILVGIASMHLSDATNNCSLLTPAAYTRVSLYRRWILAVTQT